MSLIDLILALIIGAIGTFLLAYLSILLFREIFSRVGGSRDKLKYKRALAHVKKADSQIESNQHSHALKELERAFVIHARGSRELISAIKEHNQAILSRCLIVAEELDANITNIPQIERLLLERSEIQLLLFKTNEAFSKVSSKREQAGKELPSWSKDDFNNKVAQIEEQLGINESVLTRALTEFFSNIRKPVSEDVTYH